MSWAKHESISKLMANFTWFSWAIISIKYEKDCISYFILVEV
jgi:hypothetical protein